MSMNGVVHGINDGSNDSYVTVQNLSSLPDDLKLCNLHTGSRHFW